VLSPDTLKLMDGTPVDTPELWETRRAEILEALSDVMYGHLPEEKPTMVLTPADPVESSTYWTHNIVVDMTVGETTVSTTMVVRIPKTATAENPVPVMMTPEPYGQYYQGTYLTGGWAGAGVNFGEFAPDNSTARTGKFYQLYGDDVDTGGLLVWAWCYHRLIDVLEEMAFPGIDLTKIAVTGHSRYGKCALLAGAYDERVTLTPRAIPAPPAQVRTRPGSAPRNRSRPRRADRVTGSRRESRRTLTMCRDADRRTLLVSAVAPRGLVQIEGTLDSGTNPEGSQLSYQEALRVYTMLGVPEKAGLRFRPVGHVGNDGDVLAFGNYLWNGAALPEGFNFLPYAIEPAQPANE
jgi:endo-1,4-beta-xylanase